MCHTGHIHKGQRYPSAKPSLITAKTFSLRLLSLSLILVTICINGDGSLPLPQTLRTLSTEAASLQVFLVKWFNRILAFVCRRGCGNQTGLYPHSQSSVWESLVLPFPDYTNCLGGEMVWEASPAAVCLDFASASLQGTYSNASVNWFLSPKLSWDPQLTSLFNKSSSSPAWPLSLLCLAAVGLPFVAHPRTCFLPPALGFLKTQGLFKAQLTFFSSLP